VPAGGKLWPKVATEVCVFPSSHNDLKDVFESTADQVGEEGLADTKPHKVEELIRQ
jgi:hypothetical protein